VTLNGVAIILRYLADCVKYVKLVADKPHADGTKRSAECRH